MCRHRGHFPFVIPSRHRITRFHPDHLLLSRRLFIPYVFIYHIIIYLPRFGFVLHRQFFWLKIFHLDVKMGWLFFIFFFFRQQSAEPTGKEIKGEIKIICFINIICFDGTFCLPDEQRAHTSCVMKIYYMILYEHIILDMCVL